MSLKTLRIDDYCGSANFLWNFDYILRILSIIIGSRLPYYGSLWPKLEVVYIHSPHEWRSLVRPSNMSLEIPKNRESTGSMAIHAKVMDNIVNDPVVFITLGFGPFFWAHSKLKTSLSLLNRGVHSFFGKSLPVDQR